MTRTGRPPKPTKLKILEGNPGKRRLNTSEPQPKAGAPSRPDWLLPEAKREWSRLAPELERLGLLTGVDRGAFAAYCQAWAMYVDAVKDIEENGTSYTTDKGFEGARHSVGIAVKMMEKMSAFGAKFGLSPSDRARISVPEPKAEDPFAEFLEQGKSG